MPYLIQKEPRLPEPKEWDLHEKSATVGRGEDADFKIDDVDMSRKHFRIVWEDGKYVIRDLDSRNGTWVDGKRVTAAILPENCMIRAGNTVFEFTPGVVTYIKKAAEGGTGLKSHIRKLNQRKRG